LGSFLLLEFLHYYIPKIAIYLAKERSGGDFEAVRMGFGGFRLDEIEGAVEVFAGVWATTISTCYTNIL